jgi:hypothetical protein
VRQSFGFTWLSEGFLELEFTSHRLKSKEAGSPATPASHINYLANAIGRDEKLAAHGFRGGWSLAGHCCAAEKPALSRRKSRVRVACLRSAELILGEGPQRSATIFAIQLLNMGAAQGGIGSSAGMRHRDHREDVEPANSVMDQGRTPGEQIPRIFPA